MPSLTLESTFVLSENALFRDLDGEAVILDLGSGTYFGLNVVGTRIWQLLERDGRLRVVFEELCQEFDVAPDVMQHDLLDLVAGLSEARLGEVQ